MAKVLVTGGSGYFGSILVQKMLEEGEGTRVFDLNEPEGLLDMVEFVQGDIRHYESVAKACRGVETVYHCVAQVPLVRDRALFHSVNVLGTEVLLKAASRAGVQKTVVLSSSAVYGIPSRNPVDDTVEPKPLEDYGRAKLEAERLAERFHRRHALDVTIIRPRTILGHGRLGIFQLLFDWIAEGRAVYVLGDGSNLYQLLHADDLATACLKASRRPGFAVYNVGTDRFSSMRESLEGLIAHAGTGSSVRSLPMGPAALMMKMLSRLRLAPFAPYHWIMYGRDLFFDISRARQELGWQPKWSNVEMLCQSYDWYVAHRRELRTNAHTSMHRLPVKEGALRLLRLLS